MTRREEIKRIRQHWVDFIRMSDFPSDANLRDVSPETYAEEIKRIANKIEGRRK